MSTDRTSTDRTRRRRASANGATNPSRRHHPPARAPRRVGRRAFGDQPFPLRDGHGDPPLHPEGEVQAERLGARLAAEHDAGERDRRHLRDHAATHHADRRAAGGRIGIEPVGRGRPARGVPRRLGGRRCSARRRPRAIRCSSRSSPTERWDAIPGRSRSTTSTPASRAAIARIVAAHPDERVVVVTHGGVIGHLLHVATRLVAVRVLRRATTPRSARWSSSTRRWSRPRFNDTAHLRVTPRPRRAVGCHPVGLGASGRRTSVTCRISSPRERRRHGSDNRGPPGRGSAAGQQGGQTIVAVARAVLRVGRRQEVGDGAHGLGLYGFVFAHMIGNLKIYLGKEPTGSTRSTSTARRSARLLHPILPNHVVLWVLRIGLIVMFILHIHAATTLTVHEPPRPAGRLQVVPRLRRRQLRLPVDALHRRDHPRRT